MSLRHVLALSLTLTLAVAGFGIAAAEPAGSDRAKLIADAAVAPYRAALDHDAAALCASLTPRVAATLAPESPPGTACEQGAAEVFAGAVPSPLPSATIASLRARAHHLKVAGSRASGDFELLAFTLTKRGRVTATKISYFGTLRLALEEQGGRWLVSSPARLTAFGGCGSGAPSGCAPGAKQVFFVLGTRVSEPLGGGIPVPAAVQRAGSEVKAQFAAGRTVLLRSGCLACHRLGGAGNHGPGQNLTHIGSQLSAQEIEAAIVHAREPMPSFSRLPVHELHQLVAFLSLLR